MAEDARIPYTYDVASERVQKHFVATFAFVLGLDVWGLGKSPQKEMV